MALNGKLLGKTAPPVNHLQLRGKGAFKGRAWTVPPTVVIVFAGTRNAAEPWLTPERIDAAAGPLFTAWAACRGCRPASTLTAAERRLLGRDRRPVTAARAGQRAPSPTMQR